MRKFKGFTLVELMVTLAVLAVLVAITAPSFSNIIKSNRLTTQSNALVGALAYARSEAAKRKIAVSVCARTSPLTDPETCSGTADWENGWLVFVDIDNNGAGNGSFAEGASDPVCEVNASNRPTEDCLITVQDALWSGWDLTGTVSTVSYQAIGTSGGSQTFKIIPADCEGNEAREVKIGPTGRPYSVTNPAAC